MSAVLDVLHGAVPTSFSQLLRNILLDALHGGAERGLDCTATLVPCFQPHSLSSQGQRDSPRILTTTTVRTVLRYFAQYVRILMLISDFHPLHWALLCTLHHPLQASWPSPPHNLRHAETLPPPKFRPIIAALVFPASTSKIGATPCQVSSPDRRRVGTAGYLNQADAPQHPEIYPRGTPFKP